MAKAKWPRQKSTPTQREAAKFRATEDAAYASRPSSSFAPPSSFGVEVSLVTILDQLQLIWDDFGSHLDHLSSEMCQMNTRIGWIA